LVIALGTCSGISVASTTLPAVGLATLSVRVHAAIVLIVACILAALFRLRFVVRWAFVCISVGIKLEAVALMIVFVDIVASQAWKRDVANWRGGTITLARVVWLCADVGVCGDCDTAGA
jgi:hypothetical protein